MSDSFDQDSLSRQGALLGLDYGSKRVGIAICNREQTIALPLATYIRRSEDEGGRYLAALVAEYQVVGIVVGLPMHMSGEEGEQAQKARRFGQWAINAIGLPVCFWDERLTTVTAERYLQQTELSRKKRKARIDQVAAQVMLQSYLERHAPNE